MPLFRIDKQRLETVEQKNFATEKILQTLIEKNLEVIFNSRFVASEFSTGPTHAGRIDSLALSEDNNPVIIEYKKVESSELINQSLFYLSWINDHRGDFEIAVQRALGTRAEVDWSDIRVICIAPNYKKYDLHAVQVMGANIELWTYRLFKNETLYLEEVFQRSYAAQGGGVVTKNPIMVEAGRKGALTSQNATYTVDEHIEGKPGSIRELFLQVQEFIMSLDASIEEVPKKFYIAYKIAQNIVCVELQNKRLLLYIKLNPQSIESPPRNSRDVSSIGHYGTGDFEISVTTAEELETAKQFIRIAYERIGG